MSTFRILAALFCYPEQDLFDALPEIRAALVRDEAIPGRARRAIGAFIDDLAACDLLDAQERYVALFDRNRALSLHIYEHVHGESRDRGQAMVRLADLYRLHGLTISAHELPDYLPLFLEFLSVVPTAPARSLLAEAVHVVAALRRKLEERASAYAGLMTAVEALAARTPADAAVAEILSALPAEADSLAALDRQWEEEAVRFVAGNAATACGGA